ncbi:MAG: serine acetyltransferase, partial [Solirubrobacteraceae bacterium]
MTDVYGWYRVGHVLSEHGVPVLPAVMTLVVRLLFGCYIPHQARIGRGTNFAYGGVGVVVHRDCIIGRDCSIAPGVVLGGGRG